MFPPLLEEKMDFDSVIKNLGLNPSLIDRKMIRGLHDILRVRISDPRMEQFPSQPFFCLHGAFGYKQPWFGAGFWVVDSYV